MMKQKFISLAALVACAVMALAPTQTAQAAGRRPSDVLDLAPQQAKVVNVIDGQTIQVSLNGATVTVRYIGITAPALNQCLGTAARNANAALVMGQNVRLESDVQDATSDGTLWRYVYLLDGRMASEELIKSGYAVATDNSPNIKHQGDLNDLEATARTSKVGGWRTCGWKSSVAVAAGSCTTITAERIAVIGNLPEISMWHDGDCITIFKASNPVSGEWSGQFTYHPAGSIITLSNMYVRWKDATVMITVDSNGIASATVVKDIYHPFASPRWGWDYSPVKGARTTKQQTLERDPGMPQMLQIPNPRTWLFEDAGNGKYKALTDVFIYKSGDLRPIYYAVSGYLY
jgi:endonuclease YncB( thermonuclease family)